VLVFNLYRYFLSNQWPIYARAKNNALEAALRLAYRASVLMFQFKNRFLLNKTIIHIYSDLIFAANYIYNALRKLAGGIFKDSRYLAMVRLATTMPCFAKISLN